MDLTITQKPEAHLHEAILSHFFLTKRCEMRISAIGWVSELHIFLSKDSYPF